MNYSDRFLFLLSRASNESDRMIYWDLGAGLLSILFHLNVNNCVSVLFVPFTPAEAPFVLPPFVPPNKAPPPSSDLKRSSIQLQGGPSARGLGWVDLIFYAFHCLPNFARADGNLAEAAGQYGGTQKSKSTQPRSQLTWDTLYLALVNCNL